MGYTTDQLMEIYFQEKDIFQRNQILTYLLCHMPADAKMFFLKAFKKERYLDMKLRAVRGYAVYATECEVDVLMKKLLELLKKRSGSTSYNYSEFESMRSVFLMPYLLQRYNYECFHVFHDQLEKQYNAMPDCFKNIFSLDEYGQMYHIRDSEEVKQSWNQFWHDREK